MKRCSKNFLATACLFLSALFPLTSIAQSTDTTPHAPQDATAAEFDKLGEEYDRLWKAERAAHENDTRSDEEADDKLTDDEWLKKEQVALSHQTDPDSIMLPGLLAFAKAHSDSPLALDALFIIIRRGGNQTGEIHGRPWQTKEAALDLDWSRQANDPRIVYVYEQLAGSIPSRKTEAFLRTASEKAPNRNIAAAAAFHLASYYHNLAHVHDVCRKAKANSHPSGFDRFFKLVIAPYLEQHFPLDAAKNSAEVDRLLTLVVEEYADVPADKWKKGGPTGMLLRPDPYPHPKTFGDLASSLLFEMNNIAPGKTAPEIIGADADGKTFRLSDHKGKVVLLTFSADWCGSCVDMYPMERNLVNKFRNKPFALLSVSEDEKVDTLRASLASGEITWRCWYDGEDGKIRNAWNCRGCPHLFLLDDQQVIQDVLIDRFSSEEDFEQTIESLIKKIPDPR